MFSNKNKAEKYVSRLIDSNFALSYLDTFNEMVNAFEAILPGTDCEKQKLVLELVGYIETRINEKKKLLNDLQEKMNNGFGSREFEVLFNLSFESFTKEFLARLLIEIKNHISEVSDMAQFSSEETMLREFCIDHDIPEFKVISILILMTEHMMPIQEIKYTSQVKFWAEMLLRNQKCFLLREKWQHESMIALKKLFRKARSQRPLFIPDGISC